MLQIFLSENYGIMIPKFMVIHIFSRLFWKLFWLRLEMLWARQ